MSHLLCQVCLDEPGHCEDPHLGLVCSDCYVELIYARAAMEEIGIVAGIGDCAPLLHDPPLNSRFPDLDSRGGAQRSP